jgi:hypothetical protein
MIAARVMHSLKRVPKTPDEGTSLLLVARKT